MLPKSRLLLLFFLVLTLFSVSYSTASAQFPAPTPATSSGVTIQQQVPPGTRNSAYSIQPGQFIADEEVTVVGLSAKRAQDFLDWVLLRGSTSPAQERSIRESWRYVSYAAFLLSILSVVAIGFILMIRRNRDFKLIKVLPMIILLLVYIYFSYFLTHGIYQIVEGLMRFFLTLGRTAAGYQYISTQDLLHVSFNYDGFEGARRFGAAYNESATISVLLIRLTTWTYMALSGILILRQVILWFFIIVSPFLALLIPFPLIRNTAKIWVGEYFRWLLYGLLFSMFLRGLVIIWQSGIPMQFIQDNPQAQTWSVIYPTAINILLAGPNYSPDTNNPAISSVNNIDTYANYVVALIMLWVVIILPWVLLRIFRDMLTSWLKSDSANNLMGQVGAAYSRFSPEDARAPGRPQEPSPSTPPPAGAGKALELPFRKVNIVARDVAVNQDISNANTNTVRIDSEVSTAMTQELSRFVGMQIPKITDIAKMEMNSNQLTQSISTLQKLGNPSAVGNPMEVQRISAMRSELAKRARSGDERAETILRAADSAAIVASVGLADTSGRVAQGRNAQTESVTKGSQTAVATIAAAMASQDNQQRVVAKAALGRQGGRVMPVANKMQQISLNDYEDVKKMWVDHYKNSEIPVGFSSNDRAAWLKEDIQKSETAITMLGNISPQVKQQGLEMVATILPFLLLGGFSEQETIAYLKAKVEAAKQVAIELETTTKTTKIRREEEEIIDIATTRHTQTEQHLHADIPSDDKSRKIETTPIRADMPKFENQSLPANKPAIGFTTQADKPAVGFNVQSEKPAIQPDTAHVENAAQLFGSKQSENKQVIGIPISNVQSASSLIPQPATSSTAFTVPAPLGQMQATGLKAVRQDHKSEVDTMAFIKAKGESAEKVETNTKESKTNNKTSQETDETVDITTPKHIQAEGHLMAEIPTIEDKKHHDDAMNTHVAPSDAMHTIVAPVVPVSVTVIPPATETETPLPLPVPTIPQLAATETQQPDEPTIVLTAPLPFAGEAPVPAKDDEQETKDKQRDKFGKKEKDKDKLDHDKDKNKDKDKDKQADKTDEDKEDKDLTIDASKKDQPNDQTQALPEPISNDTQLLEQIDPSELAKISQIEQSDTTITTDKK